MGRRKRQSASYIYPVGLLALALVGILYFIDRGDAPIRASIALNTVLAQDTAGYARAYGPIPLVFPDDHGAHPDFKLEWWYYTGNLRAADGRRFGYQFTIFRNALAPPDTAARASQWATNQLYLGHFALTDVAADRFYAFERTSRGAAGLAGTTAQPFRVWLEDWEAAQAGDAGIPPMRLRASQDGVRIDLTLHAEKPLVLQGDRGYSVKGPGAGNASYYYSFTRLRTSGRVETPDGGYDVTGTSWMDREWSTSMLTDEQVGWDWFSIQLADRREIVYFVVRERSPDARPYTHGAIVRPDGSMLTLAPGDIAVVPTGEWRSPYDGAAYPSGWRLQISSQGLDLAVDPLIDNQELDLSIRYWEGAVAVEGTSNGRPIQGQGYVELTGYSEGSRAFDRELSEQQLSERPSDWNPAARSIDAPPPANTSTPKASSRSGPRGNN